MRASRIEILIEHVALLECQVDVDAFISALEQEIAERLGPRSGGIDSRAIPDLSVAFSAPRHRLPAVPLGGELGRAIADGMAGSHDR